MGSKLTRHEVQNLVYTWFRKITVKVPVEEMLELLSPNDLQMKFPEETLRSHTDFKKWYQTVTNLFFDQVHDVKYLDIELDGDQAEVNLIVNWQARTWTAPEATSKWQGSYVRQHWIVRKENPAAGPTICTYEVGTFDPM